jgi:hypothetical protein
MVQSSSGGTRTSFRLRAIEHYDAGRRVVGAVLPMTNPGMRERAIVP